MKTLKKDEIWLGNTNVTKGLKTPEHLDEMKTLRIGEQAYYIGDKKKIDTNYMRPLICHKSEQDLYGRLMMERTKRTLAKYNL